jgi:hypothetical protein
VLDPLDVRFQMEEFEVARHRANKVSGPSPLGDLPHAGQVLRALRIEDRVGVPPGDQRDDDARQELAPHQAHRRGLVDPPLQIRHARRRDHVELPVRPRSALDCRDVDETVTMQSGERRVDLPERQRLAPTEEGVVVAL